MSAPELLPCPFCGSMLERSETFSTRNRDCFVHPIPEAQEILAHAECVLHDVRIFSRNSERVSAWNRRARAEGSASPPPPAEGVGEEEHGSSCTDLSCAQTHSPMPSPAGELDLDALERVALAVPTECWQVDQDDADGFHVRTELDGDVESDTGRHVVIGGHLVASMPDTSGDGDLAEFIATFDPPTVLRLLAERKALVEALKGVSDMLMSRPDIVNKLQPLIGFAEKAVFERARAALALTGGGQS